MPNSAPARQRIDPSVGVRGQGLPDGPQTVGSGKQGSEDSRRGSFLSPLLWARPRVTPEQHTSPEQSAGTQAGARHTHRGPSSEHCLSDPAPVCSQDQRSAEGATGLPPTHRPLRPGCPSQGEAGGGGGGAAGTAILSAASGGASSESRLASPPSRHEDMETLVGKQSHVHPVAGEILTNVTEKNSVRNKIYLLEISQPFIIRSQLIVNQLRWLGRPEDLGHLWLVQPPGDRCVSCKQLRSLTE